MKQTILSLFDGMSVGQIALERAEIPIEAYYASEINKKSIEVTQANYPNTIQLGDVIQLKEKDLLDLNIDILIGGSPCTNLTRAVINYNERNQGLEGEKSKLFYEYVRVWKIIKPKYFLLENVESMKKQDKDIITEVLGVEPIMINSALVSAQDRKRYYWTNIPNVTQPDDKGIYLKDVVLDAVDVEDKYWYDIPFTYLGDDKRPVAMLDLFDYDMLQRVYGLHQKSPTLTACRGGHKQKKVYQNKKCRKLTPLEYERLQTVPDNYTSCVAATHRYNMLGDGWTVDVIAHILKNIPIN
jgi:DNA (cytosine-5)-methyltransferase 3A